MNMVSPKNIRAAVITSVFHNLYWAVMDDPATTSTIQRERIGLDVEGAIGDTLSQAVHWCMHEEHAHPGLDKFISDLQI